MMKVEPVVSNNDELFMANTTQLNKINYLQSEKAKREAYIKDLQQSLILNKQSLSELAMNKKQQSILKLNQQAQLLHKKLKKYYEDSLNVNALLLIQQQLRIQQKKFYNQRMLDYQTNMIQLRKYLQDKEESFSTVVNRLKKYQDLSQVTLETKLHKFSNDLNQECLADHFRKLSEERQKYKNMWEKLNINMQQFAFLRTCFDNKQSYEAMKSAYLKLKQKQSGSKDDKGVSFCQKTKNATNASNIEHHNISASTIKNPNKQLIKLLKKQKLNNQILQQALNEAIQKNQELILQNNTLVQANLEQQIKIQKLQSKGYLLEKQLTRYDRSLSWKQQWKSKCDMDRLQRINQFKQKGQQQAVCMLALEEDMQKLSSFIMTCIPKGGLVKSSSNPNFARPSQEPIQQGQDIQIQEI